MDCDSSHVVHSRSPLSLGLSHTAPTPFPDHKRPIRRGTALTVDSLLQVSVEGSLHGKENVNVNGLEEEEEGKQNQTRRTCSEK